MEEKAETNLIAGRYRLVGKIGSGGMGVVWRARDEVLGRTVAVKELALHAAFSPQDVGEGTRRALREARIAARLHHPNVIGIYDIVDHGGRPFLVMEFLAARSLSQLIADGEPLSATQVARTGAQLAGALTAAHEAGIVHRDVKPGNVLLGDDGSVKLTDFGISRAVGDTTVTGSGVLLGTLAYLPPETAQGQPADSRGDVYALGATLYAAVEGHPPFGDDASGVALLYRIVHEELIPPRHAGPLEPILLWMLERDPARRPTMPQVRRALEAIEADGHMGSSNVTAALRAAAVDSSAAAHRLTLRRRPRSGSKRGHVPQTRRAGVEEAAAAAADGEGDGAVTVRGKPERPVRDRRQRLGSVSARRALTAALAAAALLALGGWLLADQLAGNARIPAAGSSNGMTSTDTSRASASRPAFTPSRPVSPAASTQVATSAPASPAQQNLAAQLASTIVDYYKLVPGDLNQGWNWMTADYQQNHAGGRGGYESFWSQVQRVAVSGIVPSPPSTVDATIDYYYKDGTVIEERTRFGLVLQQGRWLIASSSVLSHRNL